MSSAISTVRIVYLRARLAGIANRQPCHHAVSIEVNACAGGGSLAAYDPSNAGTKRTRSATRYASSFM